MDRRGGGPGISRCDPFNARVLASALAAVEPQVPKAPAAPEADVPPIHTTPYPPFSTVRIFISVGRHRHLLLFDFRQTDRQRTAFTHAHPFPGHSVVAPSPFPRPELAGHDRGVK